MAEVVVLRAGYAHTTVDGTLRAAASMSLVISDPPGVVDTGGPGDRLILLEALSRAGVAPEAVGWVVCTHGHTDHVSNNNLFPGATFWMSADRSIGDAFWSVDYSHGPLEIAEGVQVAWTPGHTLEDLSVIARTERGVVAIVGDLFEHASDVTDEEWMRYSRDPAQQRRSRAEILALADFVVPGHGDMFATR